MNACRKDNLVQYVHVRIHSYLTGSSSTVECQSLTLKSRSVGSEYATFQHTDCVILSLLILSVTGQYYDPAN